LCGVTFYFKLFVLLALKLCFLFSSTALSLLLFNTLFFLITSAIQKHQKKKKKKKKAQIAMASACSDCCELELDHKQVIL
jgi:hypothetical protein